MSLAAKGVSVVERLKQWEQWRILQRRSRGAARAKGLEEEDDAFI
jgi:hypothetical protein